MEKREINRRQGRHPRLVWEKTSAELEESRRLSSALSPKPAKRSRRFAGLILSGFLITLVVGVSATYGAKGVVAQFGTSGSGNGQFNSPIGVAVNETTDHVYVADRSNNRVQVFDPDGNFVSAFGSQGSGPGQFNQPVGISIDQSDQVLYVTALNHRVSKFDTSGNFILAFGSAGPDDGQFGGPLNGHPAVDPLSHDVYVADQETREIYRFDSDGTYLSKLGGPGTGPGQISGQARNLAVDSTGAVYVVDTAGKVLKFDSAGSFVGNFADAELTGDAPRAVAVDLTNDHVYVLRTDEVGGALEVAEFTPSGTLVVDHATGDFVLTSSAFFGLAVNPELGRVYVTDENSNRVFIIGDGTSPSATFGGVSDVTGTGATFTGTVNPNGFNTRYRFEYRKTGAPSWQDTGFVDVGSGTANVAVSESVTLDPNTEYEARLVADGFGPPVVTPTQTFTTDTIPPTVFAAVKVGTTTAELRGEINPNNLPTAYRFEYGTDSTYGNSIPVPDASAGGGPDPVHVSEQILGLAPDTTYHFRLVATNAAGEAVTPDIEFRTPSGAPSQRAYEKVSPADKAGLDLMTPRFGATQSEPSGNAVVYPAWGAFADPRGHPLVNSYLAHRASGGWSTANISPSMTANPEGLNESLVIGISEDLSRAVIRSNAPLDPSAPPVDRSGAGFVPLYLHDFTTDTYTLLTVPRLDGAGVYESDFLGGDKDFSHVLFEADAALTPDAVGISGVKLYKWAEGTLTLESVLPDETPVSGSGGQPATDFLQMFKNELIDNAISADGSRVFFSTPAGGQGSSGDLHVRENGVSTLIATGTRFQGATPNGRYVFHTGGRYDVETGITEATGFSAVVGFSDDGSRVYGTCGPDTVPGGFTQPGEYICLWDAGVPKEVAGPFSEHFEEFPWDRDREDARRGRYVSANGEALIFRTTTPLTGYDNTDVNGTCRRDACQQVYLYRAGASTPTNPELICLSCPATQVAPRGDSSLWGGDATSSFNPLWESTERRNLSDDGDTAFFDTPENLVAKDSNGRRDVYVWQEGGPGPQLLSSGTGAHDSWFAEASASGDDAFFATRERLLNSDQDELIDLYDARVGGGLAGPDLIPPCDGDACQDPPGGPPDAPQSGTGSFLGPGNPPAVFPGQTAPKRKNCKKLKSKKKRRKCAKTKRAATSDTGSG